MSNDPSHKSQISEITSNQNTAITNWIYEIKWRISVTGLSLNTYIFEFDAKHGEFEYQIWQHDILHEKLLIQEQWF